MMNLTNLRVYGPRIASAYNQLGKQPRRGSEPHIHPPAGPLLTAEDISGNGLPSL